jgi:hypothetical protein
MRHWTQEELQKGFLMFTKLLEFWQLRSDYK